LWPESDTFNRFRSSFPQLSMAGMLEPTQAFSSTRKADVTLPGKGNSNSHGERTIHLIITMIRWNRTSRLSIKNYLSLSLHKAEIHKHTYAPSIKQKHTHTCFPSIKQKHTHTFSPSTKQKHTHTYSPSIEQKHTHTYPPSMKQKHLKVQGFGGSGFRFRASGFGFRVSIHAPTLAPPCPPF